MLKSRYLIGLEIALQAANLALIESYTTALCTKAQRAYLVLRRDSVVALIEMHETLVRLSKEAKK